MLGCKLCFGGSVLAKKCLPQWGGLGFAHQNTCECGQDTWKVGLEPDLESVGTTSARVSFK